MPLDDSRHCSNNARYGRHVSVRGFTLVELIMVIAVLGILAVFAAPRLFNTNDFYARGFHDETLSLLRYAQKTAIAQRRTVCVTFSGTDDGASLQIASREAITTCSASGPAADTLRTIKAKAGVNYTPAPTSFNFDSQGQPISGSGVLVPRQTIQVGNAAKAITVEAVTGYVYE